MGSSTGIWDIFCLENYNNIKMVKILDVFTSKVKEELETQAQKSDSSF